MAERAATVSQLSQHGCEGHTVVWAGLLQSSSDTGAAFPCADKTKFTFQLSGTLGTGGAVTLQGSNDGAAWGTLHDAAGAALVLDAIGEINVCVEQPRFVRPLASAGDGTTDLTVTLLAKRE